MIYWKHQVRNLKLRVGRDNFQLSDYNVLTSEVVRLDFVKFNSM